ncbi:DUF2848 family protein [Nigerium massiliense]|uniref:DUF2848 family protein n=1 Tax=Nigerium massiliense TaxID=1522317 RepID=UPI00058AE2C5|nr:DUF2848 family protein [Nigerium massiliense]
MSHLLFNVAEGQSVRVEVEYALNGGYAGRDTEKVQHHIDELARLGVPGPERIPTMYPLPAMLAVQDDHVQVAHGQTSGEAEWALIVPADAASADDYLVTAACDHTDRALEVHGVAWSKQASPDLLGDVAWRYGDVKASFDDFSLRAWVTHDGVDTLIQDGTPAELLSVDHWIARLGEAGLLRPGTVFLGGTIGMVPEVDQFADAWRVELADRDGNVSTVAYTVEVLPEPWQ